MRVAIIVIILSLFISACTGGNEALSDTAEIPLDTVSDANSDTVANEADAETEPTMMPPTQVPTDSEPEIEPTVIEPSATPTTAPVCDRPTGWEVYIIQSGDTLWELSERTNSTVDALMQANCMSDDVLTRGYHFLVPRLPDDTD